MKKESSIEMEKKRFLDLKVGDRFFGGHKLRERVESIVEGGRRYGGVENLIHQLNRAYLLHKVTKIDEENYVVHVKPTFNVFFTEQGQSQEVVRERFGIYGIMHDAVMFDEMLEHIRNAKK